MNRSRWLILLVALPVLLFAAGACGDDGDDADPTATESAAPLPTAADMIDDMDSEPLQLEVVAQNFSFVPDIIEVPEDVPFTIAFDNNDSASHNIAIYADESQATDGADPLFATAVEAGPISQELDVTALAAGDYFVWCQVHTSSMTASLSVE